MRLKHFIRLKEQDNQESWILLTRYNLATMLYRLHKGFRYMITNKYLKTKQPQITFYYNDILTYIKKHNKILNFKNNSKIIHTKIIQNEYDKYLIIGQSIWNQYIQNNPWKQLWKNTFYSYNWPENNNILYMLLQFATKTNDQIYRWTNPKHVKSPNCKLYQKNKKIL